MTDMDKRDFRIVAGKGFALDLPNGVTVSVQWGPGNYCDSDCRNADVFAPAAAAVGGDAWGSDTAECAAFITGSDLSWVAVPGYTDVVNPYTLSKYWGGDDVCGHMNVSQVLDFINRASKLTGFAAEAKPRWSLAREKGDHRDSHGDYRDDLVKDERKVMDEFAKEDPVPSDQFPFPLPGQQELDFDETR